MADKINCKNHVLKNGNEQVTSYYGVRTDPVTGKVNSSHLGIDLINGVRDEKIIAFDAGVVVTVRNSYSGPTTDGSAGNYITIEHADGRETKYKHLKKNTMKVKVGQKVKKGQELATMGNTGHSTGVHLHFDVVIDGNRVDPLPYLLGEKELIPQPKKLNGQRGNSPKAVWDGKYEKDIKNIQDLLNKLNNAKILADGITGDRTYKYAKKHKVKNGVDGEVSKWVQQRLTTLGYYKGLIDGEPRGLTEKAIKAMQRDYGLTEDGVISGADWYYLLA